MESQSQNILHHDSAHIEILDDDGDENTQKMCKKSDLFKVHMKKVENPDGTKIVVCNCCSKEFKWSKSEVMTHIEDMSNLYILLKLRGRSQEVKLKLQCTFPLALNYSVTLILII